MKRKIAIIQARRRMSKTDYQSITKVILLLQKVGIPWQLKKTIEFETKTEALKAENWLKRMKSRKVIEQVIQGEIDLKEIIIG